VDLKAPVETGVPTDTKQAKFKRVGEDTTGSRKRLASEKEAVAAAAALAGTEPSAITEAEAETPAPPKKRGRKAAAEAHEPKKQAAKKPSPALMAAAAVGVLAVVGGGAFIMRGGSKPAVSSETPPGVAPGSIINVEGAMPTVDANAVAGGDQNAVATDAALQPAPDTAGADALRKEQLKAAAAEARLAAIQKAQAKAAQQARSGTQTAATQKNGKSTTAAAETNTVSATTSSGGGVSSAKLSQFYSIVDDARGMAKRVIRSGNPQNAALARSYDANLKTLRDSMRGINSEREADRLIAQAKQTRAYVQFLAKQTP
jgi:hypothetical protein